MHQVNKHGVSRSCLLKLMSKTLEWCFKNNHNYNQGRAPIKCITIAKCDLLFHHRDSKEISFYYFGDIKLYAKHKKTREFHLHCWDHVC